jgi:ribosomal protein S12 methylthiotransferase
MTKKTTDPKTAYFVSLGCPKNRVDSEVMAGIVRKQGLEIVADPEHADVIIVNTCAFIESAREESVEVLLEMATYAKDKNKLLVSAGCLSQRYGNELAKEIPELTHLLGTSEPEKIGRVIKGTAKPVQVGPPGHFLQSRRTPRFSEPDAVSAYVKIADGCTRKCSFCAIPAMRGKATSRPVDDIVAEARQLASLGIKELNLVAQDTSAYGQDLMNGTNLISLLRALDHVPHIQWIRLLYLYPNSLTVELIKVIGNTEKVVPYFDIPIQHASDRILRKMRRGHGAKQLEKLINRIRKFVPNAFLRTAVLVGHPGETADDFSQLMDFVAWARFDHLGVFRYSDEEGTHSYQSKPVVSARDSYNRQRKVMALQRTISKNNNRVRKGQMVEVMVEGSADDKGYVLQGRHHGQAPEIDGVTYVVSSDATRGQILKARVIKTDAYDLVVEPV